MGTIYTQSDSDFMKTPYFEKLADFSRVMWICGGFVPRGPSALLAIVVRSDMHQDELDHEQALLAMATEAHVLVNSTQVAAESDSGQTHRSKVQTTAGSGSTGGETPQGNLPEKRAALPW